MSVKWNGKNMGNLKFTLDQMPRKVETASRWVLTESAEMAVEFMDNTIRTTPSSIVKGKMDRIDTGHMLESVGSQAKGPLSVRIGWTKDQEDYFLAQESGTGDKSGDGFKNIAPMHALLGARKMMEQEFFETMRVVMKNA